MLLKKAMLLVLGIEILLLVAALGISHVSTQLNQNAVDILEKQVDNRNSYLENVLTSNQELSALQEYVNEEAQKNNSTSLRFSDTGIRELDQFAGAITQMNQDMLTISTKFLRIMEMASVELGGVEVRSENESVYVTDNFFSMLGKKELSEKSMTGKDFMEFLDSYNKSCHHTVRGDGSRVYSVIHNSGEIRYVRMEIKTEPDRQIGLVEDVTKVTRERMNIEHERDYDTLTGLYNRRAFQRESEKLFREHPEKHNCESSFCS